MSDKIVNNNNEDEIIKLLTLRTLRIGYSEEDFIMNFQGEEVDLEENTETHNSYNVIIPKNALKTIIIDLIKAGSLYQEQYGEDLGLPTRNNREDS